MTRYFVNEFDKVAIRVWSRDDDWLFESMEESLLDEGYVECGWWRYQWYKWWKTR